jgi:hypothetical protein
VILVKLLQLPNAVFSIVITLDGIMMLVKPVPLNAEDPIKVTFVMSTLVKLVQLENAEPPI